MSNTTAFSLKSLDDIYNTLSATYKTMSVTIDKINFNENLPATSENQQFINSLFDAVSGHILEVARADSFLQYCDLGTFPITANQQTRIMECQLLHKNVKAQLDKIGHWVIQIKAHFNEELTNSIHNDIKPNNNLSEKMSPYFTEGKTDVPSEIFQAYQQARAVLKDMHKDILFIDPRSMMETAGKRLEVMRGNTMFLETEQEMNVFIDYGIFQYRKDGQSIVDRYYNAHHKLYSGQKLEILQSLKGARFSFLQIDKPIGKNGVAVNDLLTDETFLMIDTGLNKIAQSQQNFALLTHYLMMPGFIMTTGASVPVSLKSNAGEKMWRVFERLICHEHNKIILDKATYMQCITDLFKIAIHDNVVKTLASPELPFNHHKTRSYNG